jgi:hypothetical protein
VGFQQICPFDPFDAVSPTVRDAPRHQEGEPSDQNLRLLPPALHVAEKVGEVLVGGHDMLEALQHSETLGPETRKE